MITILLGYNIAIKIPAPILVNHSPIMLKKNAHSSASMHINCLYSITI